MTITFVPPLWIVSAFLPRSPVFRVNPLFRLLLLFSFLSFFPVNWFYFEFTDRFPTTFSNFCDLLVLLLSSYLPFPAFSWFVAFSPPSFCFFPLYFLPNVSAFLEFCSFLSPNSFLRLPKVVMDFFPVTPVLPPSYSLPNTRILSPPFHFLLVLLCRLVSLVAANHCAMRLSFFNSPRLP